MRSLLNFLKYHNAVPVAVAVLVLGTGAVFAANPSVREAFFPTDSGPMGPSPAPEAEALRATDIGSFDMAFRVDAVREKADGYQVAYSYRTLEVVDRAWRTVSKAKIMDVPKALLGKRDLGLYAAEQIGQVMDREIAYLSEVKTQLVGSVTAGDDAGRYSRLAGKTLDLSDREFDGYRPVVKEKEEEKPPAPVTTLSLPGQDEPVQTVLSKEEVRQIILDSIANFLAIDATPAVPSPETTLPETVPAAPDPGEAAPAEEADGEVSAETTPDETETVVSDEETPSE